ncbi:Syntaxin-binding protein 1, partial [Fasciolopsis buskii]
FLPWLACPKDILKTIAGSRCIRFVKTLSQLDLDFIPIEPCIYTFECPDVGITHPLPSALYPDKVRVLEHLAEQLATVCVTLEEYPRICFRKTDSNMELARLTQIKLDACRDSNPNMGQGLHKDRSVLLILDRGFDPISPLVHELTLQAMCYDLLNIIDNTYTSENGKKVTLNEQNPLWKELRHTHIAHVSSDLPARVREFAASKKQFLAMQRSKPIESAEGGYVNEAATIETSAKDSVGLQDLSNLIRQLPQFQTEAAYYSALYVVTDACMRIFRQGADKLCILEQDLVMGQTAQGDVVRDPMRLLVEMFNYDFASVEDRLRLLLIFALIKDGISESHLDKLLDTAQLPRLNKALFASLSLLLGAQIIQPEPMSFGSNSTQSAGGGPQITFGQIECLKRLPPVSSVSDRVQRFLPIKNKRKDRFDSTPFAHSRWTPYLVDLMEGIIENKLDTQLFAFLQPRNTGFASNPTAQPTDSPRDFKGPSARFHASGAPSSLQVPSGPSHRRTPSPGLNIFSGGLGSGTEHCGPRLIVTIIGGATWSEARSAYQMTQRCVDTRLAESDRHTLGRAPSDGAGPPILSGGGGVGWNWEVMLGSTHMITPVAFLKDLESMSQYFLNQNNTVGAQQPGMTAGRKLTQVGFHRF